MEQPFPGVEFAEVRAYRFLPTGPFKFEDWSDHGCSDQPLTADGRLCPTVQGDGAKLNHQQVERLRTLVTKNEPPADTKCMFTPRHIFVFYDGEGRPVSDVAVCFECAQWTIRGKFSRITDQTAGELAQLCRNLGLTMCPEHDDYRARLDEQLAEDESIPSRPRPPPGLLPSQALGINATTLLSELTELERKKLCAWRAFEANGDTRVAHLTNGKRLRVLTYDECVASFPNCDVPLAELQDTDLRADIDGFVAPLECLEHLRTRPEANCIWGIEVD